jgi:hypothetical protein
VHVYNCIYQYLRYWIEVEWKIYGMYKISLPYPTSKSFLCIHQNTQQLNDNKKSFKIQNRDEHVKRLCKFHCPYCRLSFHPQSMCFVSLYMHALAPLIPSLSQLCVESELNVNISLLGQLHASDWHSFYFISVVYVQLLCVQQKKRIENIVALPFHLLL